MAKNSDNKDIVLSTPWFNVTAITVDKLLHPYYVVEASDCVSIIAQTEGKEVLLVRQYRPTINEETIELPSGHIESAETPEKAAFRELLEETGYSAKKLELLGILATDTGRLGYKLWCFFASDLNKVKSSDVIAREITELFKCKSDDLLKYIEDGKIIHAQDIAVIFLALQKGKLRL